MRSCSSCLIFLMVLCVLLPNAHAQEMRFPQVDTWKLSVEELVYTPNNLFDVIDGAADLYLEYDFVDLHIGRYTRGELEVKVELYRHRSTVDAFGIFSQERFPDYHFIDIGTQGYMEKGALNFLAGVFYVKISTIQEGQAAQDAMLTLAKAVERQLKQTRSWPSLLAAFPPDKKKVNSEQYVSKNFLGYSSLNAAFVAAYEGSPAFKAFLIKSGDAAKATSTASGFVKSLPNSSKTKEVEGSYEIQDPNNGHVILMRKDRYLYGVVSPDTDKRYDRFLDEFGRRIISLK